MESSSGKIKILTVDNETELTDLFKERFELRNYQVFTAHTAEEGLQIALREKPQAILLDLGLPDRSGIWVLERIKQALPNTRVIVLSASVNDSIREKLNELKCDLILEKDSKTSIADAVRKVEDLISIK